MLPPSSLRFFLFFFFGLPWLAALRLAGAPQAEGPLLGVLAGCGVRDCPPNFSLILSPDINPRSTLPRLRISSEKLWVCKTQGPRDHPTVKAA